MQKNKKGEVIRMKKFGQKVVKYRVLIFVISLLLLIPSAFGFITTRINYDFILFTTGYGNYERTGYSVR